MKEWTNISDLGMYSRKLGDSEYELCYSHVIPRSVLNRLEGVLLLFLRLTVKENEMKADPKERCGYGIWRNSIISELFS